jgi:GT2 family glycosyltransferase
VKVSVVMPTKDRAELIEGALQAILANTFRDFELILVDQGRGHGAADIADRLGQTDRRVRTIRDTGIGASRARNLGAGAGTGEIIAFIDDDCVARPDWLQGIVAAFDAQPDAGVACARVTPAPCDPRDGFIVGYAPSTTRRRLSGRMGKLFDSGISANMAFRRRAFEQIGGFDEMLGPGGYFVAMEDQEATYRVLGAGYSLLQVPEAEVVHYGLRDWDSGSRLIRRTYVAIAASYMKHARMGDPVAMLLLLQQGWLATLNLLQHVLARRKPLGLGRMAALFIGVRRSFDLDVDAGRALYRARA